MTVLNTVIDPRNPAYLENRDTMLERLAAFETACEAARAGGGEKWVTRHHARGKLLPRERVEMLLDQDTPFLELSPVAAWGTDFAVGASVVTGIGVVEGVECVVVANDPTVDGGAVNPYTAGKIRRAARIASVNRLPLINLVESARAAAGGGVPVAGVAPAPGAAGGVMAGGVMAGGVMAGAVMAGSALARDLTRLAAARIPTVSVVFGETTGEAANLPAFSDYTIMVRGHAKVLTIHPQPLRVGANGRPPSEIRSGPSVPLSVGGTGPVGMLGVADQLAEDERDGLRLARQYVRRFNWRKQGPGPRTVPPPAPRHDPEDLLTLVGRPGTAFEPREVLARILDDSDFDEFKAAYGPALVTGWGELHGYPVGVLATTGDTLTAAEAQKAVHFIQLANASATSLLFLQHTGGPGAAEPFEVDTARHGAPLVHAVATSTVPHLGVAIGPIPNGVGLHARAYEPRFLFSWPVERPGGASAEPGPAGRPAVDLPDDGVIDPRDTRTVLGLCLSAIHSAVVEGAEHVGVLRP
jgi:acetyl-CoA carboxylase carboxyltransferase component